MISKFEKTVDTWLRRIDSRLFLDGDSTCSLMSRDGLQFRLYLKKNTERIYLSTMIIRLEENNSLQLMQMCLEKNIERNALRDSVLAMDSRHNSIILIYSKPVAELSAEEFENSLVNFAETVNSVRSTLKQASMRPLHELDADASPTRRYLLNSIA